MQALAVETLSVRSFRNLERVNLEFCPGLNVLSGGNGQGKTNLIESIYVTATSRGFYSHRSSELIAHGQEVASVRVSVVEGRSPREQSVGIRKGGRLAFVDGRKPRTLAEYAVKTPVVVFQPGELVLSMGGGAERRRLLDRLALYLLPSCSSSLEKYSRALRERQRALAVRGPLARDIPEWEELMVRHGVEVTAVRAEASRRLADSATDAFARIASPLGSLAIEYQPGSPHGVQPFREALEVNRTKDARRGSATVGPHRDDLLLQLDGWPVRGLASQGQHRAVVLAMKSAEIEILSVVRGIRPILLLDDVSSELDRSRTQALFSYLQRHDGQVFLTTTRPELIDLAGRDGWPRRDFTVCGGSVLQAEERGSAEQVGDRRPAEAIHRGRPC